MSINRRRFFALSAVASALLVACGAPATGTGQGPRLAVDRTQIDFGNVAYGRRVQASFQVTNQGSAPLVLSVPRYVRAEAGC